MKSKKPGLFFGLQVFLCLGLILSFSTSLSAANPHSAVYSSQTDKILWFIQASDLHIGASGTKDSTNLQWLMGDGRTYIQPSFIVASGDLTDSTNGNIFGFPNGPYQAEWDQYKSILGTTSGVTPAFADFYFDIPGNHDAYNDKNFNYYLANSVQGRARGGTQVSWTRTLGSDKYLFVGTNTAGNTGSKFSFSYPYGDYAGLDTTELAFINDRLLTNTDAALTLIFGHHPLVPTGDSTDTYLTYGKTELVSAMDHYRASLYGYGHTHASSESYYNQGMAEGVFYFNVSALGKDSPNQYTVTAIDCNGISSVTQNVNTWPVVLITAPLNRGLGGVVNPYAYTVPNSSSNPIRALVFDRQTVSQVRFRINGGEDWYPMTRDTINPKIWQGYWNAYNLPAGDYTIEVQAATASGTRSDTITTSLVSEGYTLTTVVTGNGSVTKSPDRAAYPSGDVVTLTANPDPGWTFSVWSGDVSGTTNPINLTMNSNKTVTATFTQPTYSLTVNTVGSGTVSKVPNQAQYVSGSSVQLTATPAAGFMFSGWSGDVSSTTNPINLNMNSNKSVTATFTALPTYSLAVTTVGSGTVAKVPDQAQYASGSSVQLTATPAAGFMFSGWSGDVSSTTNPMNLNMNSNKSVTATFTALPTYSLAVTTVGSGTVAKVPDQAQYVSGSSVQLTATPAAGWVFSGWSGDLSGTTNPQSLTINSNKSVTATFTASSSSMHVEAITVTKGTSWILRRGVARVQIVDANNLPVQGAVVSGRWSGGASDSDTITTGADGWGSATSNWRWGDATFTFCVSNVSKSGWTYDSSANVTTCGNTP